MFVGSVGGVGVVGVGVVGDMIEDGVIMLFNIKFEILFFNVLFVFPVFIEYLVDGVVLDVAVDDDVD